MKRICFLIPLLLLVSCSVSRQMTQYAGKIQFFLPDGQTKEYDADYTKTRETKGNKTRVNESFNLHIGGDIVIAKDIPSFFVGHPVTPPIEKDYKTIIVKFQDGEHNIQIPRKDFLALLDRANEDKDKLAELLSDYLMELTGDRYAKENITIPVADL